MFGFFKKKNNACPIPEETRIWMENALIWLINQFGEKKLLDDKTLIPSENDFPLQSIGTEKIAHDILPIIAKQMDVNPEIISIDFYNEQLIEIKGDMGNTIYGQQFEDENYSAGFYEGKGPHGKYNIAIEIGQLQDPTKLIATLAHEIAHIKILGENRLNENDEYLTDLVTVFFGLGIFNANASFQFYSASNKWAYSKQGYLTQQEWGYALALYAYIRNEKKPDWIKFLTPNIQSDFNKSQLYIYENTDKVLV